MQNFVLGSPRIDQLITLIQFNVFRALMSNTLTLGFGLGWLQEESVSPYCLGMSAWEPGSCPTSLRPTSLQKTKKHHPWIDLWPIPRLRDNLLGYVDTQDEYELCNDLVDFVEVPNERTGLIVWTEPWDPSGWEISEAFAKKWPRVIEGCNDLFESTNRWRAGRGETALFGNILRSSVVIM